MNERTLHIEITSRGFLAGPPGPDEATTLREPLDLRMDALKSWLEPCDDIDRVVFTGPGEPLLHPRVAYLVRTARQYGASCVIETGAQVLEGRLVRDLIEAGLDELRVRIDAAGRDAYRNLRHEDAFELVAANLVALREQKRMLLVGNPVVGLLLLPPLPPQAPRISERAGASTTLAVRRARGPYVAVTGQVYAWGPAPTARDLADLPLLGMVADRPVTAWQIPEPPSDVVAEPPVVVAEPPVVVVEAPLEAAPIQAAPQAPTPGPAPDEVAPLAEAPADVAASEEDPA